MERKTPEEIRKSNIPYGCINVNSFDKEKELIDKCMQTYADQEMLLFANWRDKHYYLPFGGIGRQEKWMLRDKYQKEGEVNIILLSDQKLITLYKEQQDGK